MADLQPLLPRKIPQSVFAPIAPPVSDSGGMDALPSVPLPTPPNVQVNPRMVANSTDPLVNRGSALEADLYKRENPIKPTTTLGKIGHVAAGVGNVLGDIFAPDVMANIPGTQLYNERIEARDKHDLDQVSKLQTEEAGRGQEAALTDYTQQRPAIEQAKILQKLTSTLAPKGITATMNPDGTIDTEDDVNSQAYKDRIALDSYRGALQQRAQIQADNQANHYVPGTPQYEENQRKLTQIDTRLHTALAGLGLQAQKVAQGAERLGFQEDKTYNPQPTSQERNKGDMGNSAIDQIHTMRTILANHPEFAGPGGGATQAFQRWLSSNGDDAGKFLAARQYLADHSAAVFGGRGEYISKQMEGLTNPNFSPSTLGGVLDQAEETAGRFAKAGQTHNKEGILQPQQSSTPITPSLPKEISDQIPEGHQATLSDGSVWKKVGGKAEKVK